MNIKIMISLALILVCLSMVQAQLGAQLGKLGKLRPCGGRDNIVDCTCEDGETYSGLADIKVRI